MEGGRLTVAQLLSNIQKLQYFIRFTRLFRGTNTVNRLNTPKKTSSQLTVGATEPSRVLIGLHLCKRNILFSRKFTVLELTNLFLLTPKCRSTILCLAIQWFPFVCFLEWTKQKYSKRQKNNFLYWSCSFWENNSYNSKTKTFPVYFLAFVSSMSHVCYKIMKTGESKIKNFCPCQLWTVGRFSFSGLRLQIKSQMKRRWD